MSVEELVAKAKEYKTKLVEITGGEPLFQEETPALCKALCNEGFTVLVETNGSFDISLLDERAIRIVDVKPPGSAQAGSFFMGNLNHLKPSDELKFVIADRCDFDWSIKFLASNVINAGAIIFSPIIDECSPMDLAQWILDCGLDGIRIGIQLHRIIWGERRGV